jgi:hypothetical protein
MELKNVLELKTWKNDEPLRELHVLMEHHQVEMLIEPWEA